MSVTLGINVEGLEGFAQAMRAAPKALYRNLAKAYANIGRYDIEQLRGKLPGKLNVRAKGLARSFKYKATDPARATGIEKLFADEYTGWRAAAIFQNGGTVRGRGGKYLTVLFDSARSAAGRRKFTQRQLRQMLASGKARLVPTVRGLLIVQSFGGLTKSGKPKKNSRDVILGLLKPAVRETKRLDFFENARAGESMHQDYLETAIEDTLVEVAQQKA